MEEVSKEKKKSNIRKYLLYLAFVLVATGLALFLSLYDKFDATIAALASCDWRFLFIILGTVFAYITVNSSIIFIFCRLYTRKYHLPQAMASVLIATFYAGITPGSSGGQPMQAYTMSKQGVEVSNAASILVMWSILYQVALILFGLFGLIFKFDLLSTMETLKFTIGNVNFSLPIIPVVIAGFALNAIVVLFLFLMSYSHKLHNFILNHGVNIGAKLRLVKDPDKTRKELRVKVENFRIELRRLQSNIPLTIFLLLLFFVYIIGKFCLPWIAGAALNAYGDIYVIRNGYWIYSGHTVGDYTIGSFFEACFLSSFHQMVTGLIPIPGSAGVSELFFSMVFKGFYAKTEQIAAAQIIWRTASYHIPLLLGGLVGAFYRIKPSEHIDKATSQTFTNIQIETYEERKASSDRLFQTSKLSAEEIRRKLQMINPFAGKKSDDEITVSSEQEAPKQENKKEKKPKFSLFGNNKKEEKKDDNDGYGNITIG